MNLHELEDLYRQPSNFGNEVVEVACQWADEIRPGLKDKGTIPDPNMRADEVSPMNKLELKLAPYGISSNQSIAELAIIGLQRSKQKEMEKK
jgi:hypothetical protein